MRLSRLAFFPGGYATELAFAPDGVTWACARTGTIQLWRNTHRLHEIQMPGHAMGPVRFTDDGNLLLAGPFLVSGQEGRLVPRPSLVDRLGFGIDAGPLSPTQMAPQYSAFTPDMTALLVYARYQPGQGFETSPYNGPHERLILLDGRTRQPRAVLWEGNGLFNCRVLGATNTHLAAAGMGLRLWSMQTLRLLAEYPAQRVQINALRFSGDGRQLAYADAAGQLTVHELAAGSNRSWLADAAGISSLCFFPDGSRILSGGRDGTLAMWANESEPRLLADLRFPASVESLALSPHGNRLLVALGGRDQNLELHEIEDQFS
jgi:WD40 repeat protein